MTEQWCPFAIRRIGAQGLGAKNGYPGGVQGLVTAFWIESPKRGEIKHDSVGPLSATLGVLDTHPINSWHFTVDDSGLYQHYPVDANCWHGNDTDPDDDIRANIELVGVEHTRPNAAMASPLSHIQLMWTAQLTQWLMDTRERPIAVRFGDSFDPRREWELCEHNEVGNQPTACPSGRIPWDEIMRRLTMPEGAPTLEEIALASASYVHFVRNNFNLADLSERDKQAIAAMAMSVPGLPGFFGQKLKEP